ncbi:hypothetical protein ACKKBG_A32770 [Auxenochlorella protothecoides x Auxenochlorella symbiontica]
MSVCSPNPVWSALSLDPVVATPAIALLLFYWSSAVSLGMGKSPLQITAEVMLSSSSGALVAAGLSYLAVSINGGSQLESVTRAAATAAFSGAYIFVGMVCRFRWCSLNVFFTSHLVAVAMLVGASYHNHSSFLLFSRLWITFCAIASATSLLVCSLVLPMTGGFLIRRGLAEGLEALGSCVLGTLRLLCGEVDERGLLRARSGDNISHFGMDSGLGNAGVAEVHRQADAAAAAVTTFYKFQDSTRWEAEFYRRQWRFPVHSYQPVAVLLHSAVSSAMMVVYPLQTGRMDCRQARAHAHELLTLGYALAAVLECAANVLRSRARARELCPLLDDMESRYVALLAGARASAAVEEGVAAMGPPAPGAAASKPLPGPTAPTDIKDDAPSATSGANQVAFHLVLSTLFTLCTRVRRLAAGLADAVAAEDPTARRHLARHFAPRPGNDWRLHGMAQELRGAASLGPAPLSIAGISLVSSPHGPGSSSLAYFASTCLSSALLSSASLACVSPKGLAAAVPDISAPGLQAPIPAALPLVQASLAWHARWSARLAARTGVTPAMLALGLQGATAYLIILTLLIIPTTNDAFNQRTLWAIFIVITILEPFAGGVFVKALQRITGTLVGLGCGLAVTYFTYLCNGLSYDNEPAKFIVMTLGLSLFSGVFSACTLLYPSQFYSILVASILLALGALPGYHTSAPMPSVALWRLAATALGVGVEVLVAATVFPVTARATYRGLMAESLQGLGDLLQVATGRLVSGRAPSRGRGSGACGGKGSSSTEGVRGGESGAKGGLPGEDVEAGAPRGKPGGLGGGARCQTEDVVRPARVWMAPTGGCGLRVTSDAEPGKEVRLQSALVPSTVFGPMQSCAQGWDPARHLSVRTVRVSIPDDAPDPGSPQQPVPLSPSAPATTVVMDFGQGNRVRMLGSAYLDLMRRALPVSTSLEAIAKMAQALQYEFYPFSKVKRFPLEAGDQAQRLCLCLLNVASSFAAALDSNDAHSSPFLLPHRKEVKSVAFQLSECLLGLAGVVRRTAATDRVVDMSLNLKDMTRHLFVSCLSQSEALGSQSHHEFLLGVSFLAMMFNAGFVIRMLAMSLVRCVCAGDAAAQAAVDRLADAEQWALDEELMLVCNDLMAVAQTSGDYEGMEDFHAMSGTVSSKKLDSGEV